MSKYDFQKVKKILSGILLVGNKLFLIIYIKSTRVNAWQSFADSLLRKLKRWPSWLKDHFEIIGIHTHFLKCSNKIPRVFFKK